MPIATQKFLRKPLYVDAVRVTAENFDEIVSWCQGEVQADEVPGDGTSKRFIKVRVHNPKNPRQTKAFVGDWLLYTERGYKVYTNKAFHASFDPVPGAPITIGEPAVDGLTNDAAVQAAKQQSIPAAIEATLERPPAVEQPLNVDVVPEQESAVPAAVEGKRVISIEEQGTLTPDEVRELVQSGEAVLAQDIAQP